MAARASCRPSKPGMLKSLISRSKSVAPVLQRRQRGASVAPGRDAVARLHQQALDHQQDHLVVVDQQQMLALAAGRGRRQRQRRRGVCRATMRC